MALLAVDPIRPICLDIETAGCLRGVNTTQFHPVKLLHWDKIAAKDVLVSCSLSWRTTAGQVQSAFFNLRNPVHRKRLVSWLEWVQTNDLPLVIQNAVYDLTFLRHFMPVLKKALGHPTRLADLMVASYLVDEFRPEKSLKALAPLLLGAEGLYREDQLSLDFTSPDDPKLAEYNVADTSRTLQCFDICHASYQRVYGAATAKGTPSSDAWYSTVLHLVTRMSETGVPIKVPELRHLHRILSCRAARIVEHSKSILGLILTGKGTDVSKRAVVRDALDALGENTSGLDKYIKPTKTGKLPYDSIARAALLERLNPRTHRDVFRKLRVMGLYQGVSKILNTYTGPMLHGRIVKGVQDNSPRVISNRVYPTWFPVPREFGNTSGGTKQGRLSAKDPSVPTFPPRVKALLDCDLWVDYSQIELRAGALLSNDPVMMAEYRGKPDLHARTARLIFGDDIVNDPHFKDKYRQCGKVINFLMLYRGGADKFQRAVLDNSGFDMPLNDCRHRIARFWATYQGLKRWQDGLIATVERQGFLELPITGISRRFVKKQGGKGRFHDRESLPINEICNFPVQTIAAQITLSAQAEMWRLADARGWRGITLPVNIYDAIGFVLSPLERNRYGVSRALALINEVMLSPPFYKDLTSHLGRDIPLGYEVKDGNGKKILEV